MALPVIPPLFGGHVPAVPAGLDLPQAIVTADDAPEPQTPTTPVAGDDAGELVSARPCEPMKTPAADATVTRPAPAGRVVQAESRAYVALTEAPFPRHEWVGVPVGAPTPSAAHSMMIYASAADKAQIVATLGQAGDGASIPTTPLVIPASGTWVRVTAAVTLHVLVFGF